MFTVLHDVLKKSRNVSHCKNSYNAVSFQLSCNLKESWESSNNQEKVNIREFIKKAVCFPVENLEKS